VRRAIEAGVEPAEEIPVRTAPATAHDLPPELISRRDGLCGEAAGGYRASSDGRGREGSDRCEMLAFTSTAFPIVGSLFSLNGRPRYIHEGWFLISVANLTVILLMIGVFVLALVLPFPHDEAPTPEAPSPEVGP
jgi:hypothetical protein